MRIIGVAASSVVHKLNDLFVGKDNLSDLFMGGQFQHFLASPKYAFSRNYKPSVKCPARVFFFTVIAHRPEHPLKTLNTLHTQNTQNTQHTQNTNGRKLRGNACSDRPKAGFPPPVLTTAQPSVG